jgi:hypothetical protein
MERVITFEKQTWTNIYDHAEADFEWDNDAGVLSLIPLITNLFYFILFLPFCCFWGLLERGANCTCCVAQVEALAYLQWASGTDA